MTRNTCLPAVKVRRWVYGVVCSTLAVAFPLMLLHAQQPGPNVNMVSGKSLPDGDPFLQRQNEPSGAVSTRNALHLLAGANDYRTVDAAQDMQIGTPSTIQRSFFAKLLTPFRKPRVAIADADHASALAWIGLSFTDNGTNFYTGLHPASPFSPPLLAAKPRALRSRASHASRGFG